MGRAVCKNFVESVVALGVHCCVRGIFWQARAVLKALAKMMERRNGKHVVVYNEYPWCAAAAIGV